jgi:GR25 family glycosyltransferase involved in LPS biosynthesis
MKVYVINLDSESERMKTVHDHLEACGLGHYERVSAVKGGTKEENISDFALNMCSNGAMGCSASHRKIWKEVIDQDLDMVMILEDDVRFVDGAMDELEKALEDLPDDFDILYVGSSGANSFQATKLTDFLLYPLASLLGRKGEKISDRLVAPLVPFDMHAYIVSNKGAKKLFGKEQVTCLQDFEVAVAMADVKMYACEPSLARQATEVFDSNRNTKFPFLLTKYIPRARDPGICTSFLEVLNTFPVTGWTLILGIVSAFQPLVLLLIVPDIYKNFNMVLSTLLINLLVRVILSRR